MATGPRGDVASVSTGDVSEAFEGGHVDVPSGGGVSACGGDEENSGGGEEEEPASGVSSSEEHGGGGQGFLSTSGAWLGLNGGRRLARMPRGNRPAFSLSEDSPPSHEDTDIDRDVLSFPLLR